MMEFIVISSLFYCLKTNYLRTSKNKKIRCQSTFKSHKINKIDEESFENIEPIIHFFSIYNEINLNIIKKLNWLFSADELKEKLVACTKKI